MLIFYWNQTCILFFPANSNLYLNLLWYELWSPRLSSSIKLNIIIESILWIICLAKAKVISYNFIRFHLKFLMFLFFLFSFHIKTKLWIIFQIWKKFQNPLMWIFKIKANIHLKHYLSKNAIKHTHISSKKHGSFIVLFRTKIFKKNKTFYKETTTKKREGNFHLLCCYLKYNFKRNILIHIDFKEYF